MVFRMRQIWHDIVAEWSKATRLGRVLSWRRFKSCRCHCDFNLQIRHHQHPLTRIYLLIGSFHHALAWWSRSSIWYYRVYLRIYTIRTHYHDVDKQTEISEWERSDVSTIQQKWNLQSSALPLSYRCCQGSIQRESNTWPLESCLEMRGIEPLSFRMQSGRAATVPHPQVTKYRLIQFSKSMLFHPSVDMYNEPVHP